MFMWIIIFVFIILLAISSISYTSNCLYKSLTELCSKKISRKQVFAIVLILFFVIGLLISFINAFIVFLYLTFFLIISDILHLIIKRVFNNSKVRYIVTIIAVLCAVFTLLVGWYLDHSVVRTEYNITTDKNVPDLKILMFADSHVGTTFDGDGFAKHIAEMQKENADIVFLLGDFVDDDTTVEDMKKASFALGKLKTPLGIFFVHGNHDKGYYGDSRGFSTQQLEEELHKNGVVILKDESKTVKDGFYSVIGRKDLSVVKELKQSRLSPEELLTGVTSSNKYAIVLDHQPYEYDLLSEARADLVLSGHTHGGQLFPFNQVGKLIGAVDLVYGIEKRSNTDFIVTSGISDWAIKFKTGTRSEYVVINVKSRRK